MGPAEGSGTAVWRGYGAEGWMVQQGWVAQQYGAAV